MIQKQSLYVLLSFFICIQTCSLQYHSPLRPDRLMSTVDTVLITFQCKPSTNNLLSSSNIRSKDDFCMTFSRFISAFTHVSSSRPHHSLLRPTASGLDAVLITLQRKPPSNNPLFRAEHYSSVCLDTGD